MRTRIKLIIVTVLMALGLVAAQTPASASITLARINPCAAFGAPWYYKATFSGNVGANNYFSYSDTGVFQAVKSGTGTAYYYAVGTPGYVQEKNSSNVVLSTRNYVYSSTIVNCT